MTDKVLTEKEEKFIDLMFELHEEEFTSERQRLLTATKLAGYADGTSPYTLVQRLLPYIIERGRAHAAANIPQALNQIAKVMSGAIPFGSQQVLKSAEMLTNLAGLHKPEPKKEERDQPLAFVLLPPKDVTPNPQSITHSKEVK